MWRNRRRTIIVCVLLAALLLLVVLPYFILHREAPSCFDTKQNQSEEGVDCGGPCSLVCAGKAEELKIVWAKIFPVRSGAYDLVAYVENTNSAMGAPRIPYTARLFDAEGSVIAERKGETFASPNEHFAVFVGNMLTGEKIPAKGSITITPGFAWVTVPATKNIFTVSEKVLVGTDKVPKLSALLSNTGTEILRGIDVTVVIYDSTSNPIAVSATTVEKLDQKGSEKLFFTWPKALSYVAETEKCETPVDIVLALDRSGSMASDGRNPPQPLTDAKVAAEQFVDRLTENDQAGYVSFATTASNPMEQPLTNNASRLKAAIDRTAIGTNGLQYTNIGDAIRRAIDELGTFRRQDTARPIIVLLTDGIPTRPEDPNDPSNKDYAGVFARQAAFEAKSKDIGIYTIGLGDEADGKFLADLSTSPEYYYKAASGAELGAIYQQIATAICRKGPSVIEIIPRVNTMVLPSP